MAAAAILLLHSTPGFGQGGEYALMMQQTPPDGGTVTPQLGINSYGTNKVITLTATPAPGYQFLYRLGDVSEAGSMTTTVVLDCPKIILAVFERTEYEVLDDNPFYVRDYSQCILCWRCVQVCADDMQYTYALGIGGRGHESHINTFFDIPMPETTCVFCGNCVGVCPTNALQGKTEFLVEKGLQHHEIRARRRRERQEKRS